MTLSKFRRALSSSQTITVVVFGPFCSVAIRTVFESSFGSFFDRFWVAPGDPRDAQGAPQGAPGASQDTPGCSQSAPGASQGCPRSSPRRPRTPQETPKVPQEHPKTTPRPLKIAPGPSFHRKRCRKRNRRGFETWKITSVRL